MPRNPYLDQVPKQEFPLTSYYLQSKLNTVGGSSSISASYADTASYAVTASYALNGGSGGSTFPYTGSAEITGSLNIIGTFSVVDSVSFPNINSSQRTLYDSIGRHNASLDWDGRNLKDTSGTTVINWNSGLDLQSGSLKITSGENTVVGTAKLSLGCVLVSNTSVTANSLIFLTTQIKGGQPGALYIGTKTPGVSFEVSSSLITDTSTFAYMIVN